ncbi:hypothetical protein AAY473_035771 [Plecturocebus cupreus]
MEAPLTETHNMVLNLPSSTSSNEYKSLGSCSGSSSGLVTDGSGRSLAVSPRLECSDAISAQEYRDRVLPCWPDWCWTLDLKPSAHSASQRTGITGMSHRAQPISIVFDVSGVECCDFQTHQDCGFEWIVNGSSAEDPTEEG